MVEFLLVPSPLVGPTTWRWVGEALSADGHGATIVAFGDAATTGGWSACVDAAVAQAPCLDADAGLLVVGHSGAGLLLPSIAARLPAAPARLVFVDAPFPAGDEPTPLLPAPLLEHLRSMADADGLLPPWSEWFGPDTMARLVPDPDRRAAVVADLPRLPFAYFDDAVPPPARRSGPTGAYILLSEVYRADAEVAATAGWPVVELPGAHLDLVTEPERIAAALRALAPS